MTEESALCADRRRRLEKLEELIQAQVETNAISRAHFSEMATAMEGLRAELLTVSGSVTMLVDAVGRLTAERVKREEARQRWRKIAWGAGGSAGAVSITMLLHWVWAKLTGKTP